MKKTIMTFVMLLMIALAAPMATGAPITKTDSVIDASKKGVERVREKIDQTLDDTIASSTGGVISFGNESEMTPEDIKEISNQRASVAKQMFISGSFCLLGLVTLVLLFRFLNRRNKYRVIEKAIENNYPLNELSLTDVKRSAIYVQQPVVTTPPVINAATPQQPGGVPVGAPISGQTPTNPIVMTDMVNWRAMTPAVKWIGWGTLLILFSVAIGDSENPFWPVGLALMVVGLCKGFILYKEQMALQEAWRRAEQMRPQQDPMREGIPVPPAFDQDYKEEDNTPYQSY